MSRDGRSSDFYIHCFCISILLKRIRMNWLIWLITVLIVWMFLSGENNQNFVW